MSRLFAMEELTASPYIEPITETDAGTDAIDASLGEEEVIRQQAEIGDAICIAETLEAIGVEVEKAPDGVSAPVGRALGVAIEHLINIDFGDGSQIGLPAFEEFSTYRARKQMSMESIEKIKEFGKKLWEWIKKLIKDVIASVKKLFNLQNVKQKAQETEIDAAVEGVKKAKGEAHSQPAPNHFKKSDTLAIGYTPTGFKDKVTMHRLATNGRFVGGEETIASFKHNNELLYKLEYGFLRIEKDVIDNLETALRNIYASGKKYSEHINLAMVAVTAALSGHQIPNRRPLPAGVRTFETPMIFGGMSIYREAVVGEAELNEGDLHTSFDITSNQHETQLPEVAPYLTLDQVEAGLALVRARWTTSSGYIKNLEKVGDSLDSLEGLVGKVAIENTNNAMVQRRARRILQVIHSYLETRRVFANSMVSYSHAVNAAMLNYCVKSTHAGSAE